MQTRRRWMLGLTTGLMALAVLAGSAIAAELMGTVKEVDAVTKKVVVTEQGTNEDVNVTVNEETKILKDGQEVKLEEVKTGASVTVTHEGGIASKIELKGEQQPE